MELDSTNNVVESQNKVLTVSEFSAYLKKNLEGFIDSVWITGELSGVFKAQSGHVYCQIKDQNSQIKLVIFKGVASKLLFDIREGIQVVLCAQISMYQPRGELQLIAKKIEPEGIGALKLAYEQLKSKLLDEGLFREDIKKEIPEYSSTIGLITSKDGAVLHDMINVIRRRNPLARIIHYVTPVQGKGASTSIIKALEKAKKESLCQIYIIARGGGSLEDLWNFNEESVVRSVAEFSLPIISAIGHETDITLCDFVADKRAPTPSIAAELVTPDFSDIDHHFRQIVSSMRRALLSQVVNNEQKLDYCSQRLKKIFIFFVMQIQQVFKDFRRQGSLLRSTIETYISKVSYSKAALSYKRLIKRCNEYQNTLTQWPLRSKKTLIHIVMSCDNQLVNLGYQLKYSSLNKSDLEIFIEKVSQFHLRLKTLTNLSIKRIHQRLAHSIDMLENRSYQNTLKRGFTLLLDTNGKTIRSSSQIQSNREYQIVFYDGQVSFKISDV